MGLKSIFSSKGKDKEGEPEGTTKAVKEVQEAPISPELKQQWANPPLVPGAYGGFPLQFSLQFAFQSKDRTKNYFGLVYEWEGVAATMYAVTFCSDMVKCCVYLHSKPDVMSAPLGLAGVEKYFRTGCIVAMPPPANSGDTNHVERMSAGGGLKAECYRFSSVVGLPGSAEQKREVFEWRRDLFQKEVSKDGSFERRLVRVSTSTPDNEDVVCKWLGESKRNWTTRLGRIQFVGTGATDDLGPYWRLMAVMTMLRIMNIDWDVRGMAKDLAKIAQAAGRIAGVGAGL